LKRVKRRYLALQLEFDGSLNESEFMSTLWTSIVKLFGEYGASLTNLSLIDYREDLRIAIIRVNLVALDIIRASVASVTSLANKPIVLNVVVASGTLKGLSGRIPKIKK
jgi:RNase P/RNase MRP subunit POP5